jgi:hypothetical protein
VSLRIIFLKRTIDKCLAKGAKVQDLLLDLVVTSKGIDQQMDIVVLFKELELLVVILTEVFNAEEVNKLIVKIGLESLKKRIGLRNKH